MIVHEFENIVFEDRCRIEKIHTMFSDVRLPLGFVPFEIHIDEIHFCVHDFVDTDKKNPPIETTSKFSSFGSSPSHSNAIADTSRP